MPSTSDPLQLPTTIVLTGGTSGIGLALSARLAEAGHTIIVLARHASSLPPAPRLIAIDIDLADTVAVRQLGRQLAVAHPRISVLINNAALQYGKPLTDPDFDPARMESEVAINLTAPALLIHALLPALRTSGPRAAIVNVSSGLAVFPKQATALYCATKAALSNFTRSLRYQLQADGVLVSEVVVPLVDTPMTAGRGTGKITADAAAAAILAGITARRDVIHVGKARLLPVLSRLAPGIGHQMLRGS